MSTDTQPDPRDAEITILRGRVAELERALWQAKHDYGKAMQQNARHATTIAGLRRARTAEDERRDVLLYLRNRCAIFMASQEIERGYHVGAAEREAVKP